jgi:hypothetical protein
MLKVRLQLMNRELVRKPVCVDVRVAEDVDNWLFTYSDGTCYDGVYGTISVEGEVCDWLLLTRVGAGEGSPSVMEDNVALATFF